MKDPDKSLGIVITGGSDTIINKVLVESVEDGSVAINSYPAIKKGDEIIEVNEQNLIGMINFQLKLL